MIWVIIICCGLATFAARFLPLSGILPAELPKPAQQAMKFVPVAVLVPIILSSIFVSTDSQIELVGNMRIYAALIAGVVAVKTRNVIFTIITGLVCLWALEFLF